MAKVRNTSSGDWDTSTAWTPNGTPEAGDDVDLVNYQVVATASMVCKTLTSSNQGFLYVDTTTGNKVLTVTDKINCSSTDHAQGLIQISDASLTYTFTLNGDIYRPTGSSKYFCYNSSINANLFLGIFNSDILSDVGASNNIFLAGGGLITINSESIVLNGNDILLGTSYADVVINMSGGGVISATRQLCNGIDITAEINDAVLSGLSTYNIFYAYGGGAITLNRCSLNEPTANNVAFYGDCNWEFNLEQQNYIEYMGIQWQHQRNVINRGFGRGVA